MKTVKRIFVITMTVVLLTGCSKTEKKDTASVAEQGKVSAYSSEYQSLKAENSDVFGWVWVPGTDIDYPVLQSSSGDDSFYKDHDYLGRVSENGAIYTEAANMTDMCDFNEVMHGSSPSDGTMFAPLQKFLDRDFFDQHKNIYVYMDGNSLTYAVFAAFVRDDKRLLEQYDFTYASGCQAFLDEISEKSMNKNVVEGWEEQIGPENFLLTLSTVDKASGKQVIVVSCLIGDPAGKIDRFVDYGGYD
ncbi:class B sortase [Butyrivibrio sp. YAB3001]|uniref:class B sortase n=1 Tax=Butyrivibrio sp. YAB3001 TaxID=1520812 RepID=UPI00158807E1|nr:class B sortase [Butyrivibrio sp. YAB3001]